MSKQVLFRLTRLPLLAAALLTAACDDPFANPAWSDVPDTVTVFSAYRSEYAGRPSAINLTGNFLSLVAIDELGAALEWDFMLGEEGGDLLWIPSSVVPGREDSRSSIASMDAMSLEEVRRAPEPNGDRYTKEPVALEEGAVYVLRSRRSSTCYIRGSNYAKMKVVDLDFALGTAEIEIVRNPYCDNRDLVPPDED
ncbi:MAG: hypothetical protein ACYC28_01415 [Longimicrobiales bacterium]